jgi:amino acid transporter
LTEKSEGESFLTKARHALIGKPRDIKDSSLFHKLSLIPLLAWIGLGADGLSSSSYGPEEAFRAIGSHAYLGVFLAIATAFTVLIISYSYSRIIEHFPHGGGGYIVATHTISEGAGVISGCALLVDYMLTITVSLVSCADALFSFLPMYLHIYKLGFVAFLIVMLVVLNMRGVKESVLFLAPIFMIFVVTHMVLLGYGILSHASQLGPVASEIHGNIKTDLASIGFIGILALFLRAYSLGAGTYTGIEAVSNGLQIMREPKVQTGKRTMAYMASSLALTAGGLFICYLLWKVVPVPGKTLNAILATSMFGHWPLGNTLALVTILSEGALLLVGAQAGFIDGPRVMSNMAIDSWFPRRFASLSERLTMQNGVVLMGIAAIVLLFYTHGSISALVIMYSINVFLTFSLSQFGMSRYFIRNRSKIEKWKRHLLVHLIAFVLCITILAITVFEKFTEGGWVTLLITSAAIGLCYLIKRHYGKVKESLRRLDELLMNIPANEEANNEPLRKTDPTAILLVTGFNSLGLHTLLSIVRYFPNLYRNFIFVSVAEVDSGSFKGADAMDGLRLSTQEGLQKYVKVTRRHGFPADYRMEASADVIDTAVDLCRSIMHEYPRSTVFTGQLVFHRETFTDRILHNQTAYAIQRRLQWEGIPTIIMPIRVDMGSSNP